MGASCGEKVLFRVIFWSFSGVFRVRFVGLSLFRSVGLRPMREKIVQLVLRMVIALPCFFRCFVYVM